MRKHLTAALVFVLLTIVLTNPLAFNVWDAVEDKQDALLNTWITAWVGHALVTNPLALYDTNIFYPYPNTLAFSEILLPPSLIALPITLASHNPIFAYNLALLAMLWLDAFAMYLFVYELTRRAEAGWVAGLIYAFDPFNLGNLAQLQLLTLGWLPLALLFLHRLLTRTALPVGERVRAEDAPPNKVARKWLYAVLFALFFVLQALSSFYYALLSGVAVALYLLWWLWTRRRDLTRAVRSAAGPMLSAFVLIIVCVTPFIVPYLNVSRELGFQRGIAESEPFSASLKQFAQVAPANLLYGGWLAPQPVIRIGGYPLDNLFPGILALALTIVGIVWSRAAARWFLLVLLLVAFVLALGPRLYLAPQVGMDVSLPYRWLYELFPPMRALRAPIRFDVLVNFALAGLAGLGTAAVIARLERVRPTLQRGYALPAGTLILLALVTLEYLALPAAQTVRVPVGNAVPATTTWLAQQPHTVVLELPMLGPNAEGELDITTQYLSTYHWQDTPDGYSGFVPPRRGEIALEMQAFPSPRSIALLRALGVRYVLVHTSDECRVFAGPIGYIKPEDGRRVGDACVYAIPLEGLTPPNLEKKVYVPSTIALGAPFDAYLILSNEDVNAFAVKPTDKVALTAEWSDGRTEEVSFPIPLVTSSITVVPVRLTAPARAGEYELRLSALDPLIGQVDIATIVRVGSDPAHEVVIPASVELAQPLAPEVARGSTLAVPLRWLPHNKIDAYYSASVRLVNENGDKVVNVDRQPVLATLLWQPEAPVTDTFELPIPQEIPPGKYSVQVLMYQADQGEDALLLDGSTPAESITLGELVVK